MRGNTRKADSGNERPPISGWKGLLLLSIIVVVAVVVAVPGIVERARARTQLRQQTIALAAPMVVVAKPKMGEPSQEVVLPGNIEAYVDSGIYARTDGYLKKWYFDIGAHVRKGQLLAVIESPEVDQELAQAKADLATAEANESNARIQAARYQKLLKSNAVSTQDTDDFTTQAASTETQVKSALANMQRLQQLVGFEKIYAPFDGTITARNVDIGTLIDSGTGKELFHLSQESVLRVYVNVPQVYSPACVPGVPATLTLAQFPGRKFKGKIVRTAKAIDPASRTLLVEVDVKNPTGELYPGAYAQVHFKLQNTRPSLILPVSTLIFRSQGLQVGIVEDGNKAKLIPITIGRDDGNTVEVIEGLQADDEVIQSPPDSLIDGETVQVVKPQPVAVSHGPEGGQ
ncbi:MAG TPA: efflux RND transporter periplasmic adaptor subunit [Acidobacteriaceae bacterium]|nr:efflux RND transporter periplasmic adaptor subunit [Acidobacteriaceae bacterium]